jgi:hypothetical protein
MSHTLRSRVFAGALLSTLAAGACALDACSGASDLASPVSPSADASTSDAPIAADDGSARADGGADATPSTVTFRYTPSWSGVTAVTVIGGFGQASDFSATQPFATLKDDGTGTFTGSATLASGAYLYLFHVVGDSASSTPATYARYAVDPFASVDACPAQSPTYTAMSANPCSKLTVPAAGASPTAFHVRGVVRVDGQPAGGYLVQLDRNETGSHHFFVNRVTTKNDGTFDVTASAGSYRLQVLHPTYLSSTDVTRDPISLQALRRAISSTFLLAADVTVSDPEVAFHEYAAFAPRDAGTLPTHFVFAGDGGGVSERLTVYGGTANEIGDPWYASGVVTGGAADFDGGFDTKQAGLPSVKIGDRYFWGTETSVKVDGGVSWTGQTMVFPITWR